MRPKLPQWHEVFITTHAYKRANERLGLGKPALQVLARKAFEFGLRHKDTKGELHAHLFKIINVNNMRLYGDTLFLFQGRTLVTVYPLLPEVAPLARELQWKAS